MGGDFNVMRWTHEEGYTLRSMCNFDLNGGPSCGSVVEWDLYFPYLIDS